jgi:predicted nuclease of predicted toxin-antitoxin system
VRLLLDEMYSPSLAPALRAAGVEAVTVAGHGLAGRSDLDVFAAATADGYALSARTSPTSPASPRTTSRPGAITLAC